MKPLVSSSPQQTEEIARQFAGTLKQGDVVALYGELGTGKTQFVRGVAKAFGVTQRVLSPTFVLVHRYGGRDESGREMVLYHADLYRIQTESELYDIGFEELVGNDAITLIEWADRLSTLLPPDRIDVRLSLGQRETERIIDVVSVKAGAAQQGQDVMARIG